MTDLKYDNSGRLFINGFKKEDKHPNAKIVTEVEL